MTQRKLFAIGSLPGGTNGRFDNVGFSFDAESGKTTAIWGSNKEDCFTYHTPQAMTEDEALWLLKTHPSSNASNIRSCDGLYCS